MKVVCSLIFLLSLLHAVHSGYSWGRTIEKGRLTGSNLPGPEFQKSAQNIVVSPGQTAVLPCRVDYLADKVVSWIRRRDLHILSSGRFIYTADERFKVLHPEGDSAAWGLQLRNPTHKDEGVYECQINTDPTIKQDVRLTVSDKSVHLDITQKDDSNAYGTESAVIIGPRERYVKLGSTFSLSCQFVVPTVSGKPVARGHQLSARLVDWLHFDKVLSFSTGRGGVRIDTEKDGSDVISQLTLAAVKHEDAGTYTCMPYHSKATSVSLIVIDGEHSEAMQGDLSSGRRTHQPATQLLLLTALTFILSYHTEF